VHKVQLGHLAHLVKEAKLVLKVSLDLQECWANPDRLDFRDNFTTLHFLHYFRIDVTFEMRTILSEICLLNHDHSKHGHHIYMKRKEGEREQDSGKTERESV